MAKNLFSVPIFFILFRETLEAAIIVSVLLGLAKQIVYEDSNGVTDSPQTIADGSNNGSPIPVVDPVDHTTRNRNLLRKLRIQIFLGTGLGLLVSVAIGAAFIAVWFTKASNLWSKSEQLWTGIFQLIAAIMIFAMGITMLKMDRAKSKWRIKLQQAFEGQHVGGKTKTGKWVLFILPFVTVLREGIEAVVFVGGVSLGQPATAIPIAAIVGLICGIICGLLIYQFASRATLRLFLIVITNLLLLIGAGLFTKSIASFEDNAFSNLLGASIDDSGGTGPGSYRVQGNVWHLDCCSPSSISGQGWSLFNAIFGWSNNASIGTVLSYIFYWLAVIAVLVYLKYKEGRTTFFGRGSAAHHRRTALKSSSGGEPASEETNKDNQREEKREDATEGLHILPRN